MSYSVANLSVPVGFCTLSAMEVFLRVSFHWDFFQLINGFVFNDFHVRPVFGESCVQRIRKSFLSLVKTRCFISFPLVPKRSSTNRLMILAKDFPVPGLPAMGSSVFSNAASISDCSRDSVTASSVPFCCAMALCHLCSQSRSRDCIEYST